MSRSLQVFLYSFATYMIWLSSSLSAFAQPCDDRAWYDDLISGFYTNGVDGTIHATLVDNEGNFWVAGEFSSAENVIAHNVAFYDGERWQSPGLVDGPVYALAEFQGSIIVGGAFSSIGEVSLTNIAAYSGSSWGPLSGGVNNTVRALHVFNNALIAGGDFSTAGSVGASRIASWDGGQWSTLGTGMVGATVSVLSEYNGALIAGGSFSIAGGTVSQSIASWNGSSWSALDEGITGGGSVLAVLPHSSGLYVGGAFDHVNELPGTRNLAMWNGSAWNGVEDQTGSTTAIVGVSGTIRSLGLTTAEDFLVVGGDIQGIGGTEPEFILHYNLVAPERFFAPSPTSFDGPVYIQTEFDNQRVFAGSFTNDGSTVLSSLATEQAPNSWTSLSGAQNLGILGSVAKIERFSATGLVVVGDFTAAGNVIASNIAVFESGNWSALPGQFNGRINAVAAINNGFVVGGEFTKVDDMRMKFVARFQNDQWHELDTGANAAVFAVDATSPSNIFCGGDFTAIGTTSANRIAHWDGSEWVALSSGMNARVNDIAIARDNDNYALIGGAFTAASGIQSNSIAYWTGDRWRSIGNGVEGIAYDVQFVERDVFVAVGEFTDQNVNSSSIVAGSVQLLQLIGGFDAEGIGYAVAAGDQVVVGGTISSMIDCPVSNIGRLDSTASAFGKGTNGVVAAITWFGDGWIVGGDFSSAGNSASSRLAYIPECEQRFWLNGETQLCPGTETVISIEVDPFTTLDGASIAWSDGSTSATVTFGDAGEYFVTVVWPNGCQYTDYVHITESEVVKTNILNLTNLEDTFEFCSGASITVGALGFEGYTWSNNETTAVIDIHEPGDYWVTAMDDRGCLVVSDTITVYERQAPEKPEVVVEMLTGGGDYLDQYFSCEICEQYEDVRWFVNNMEVDPDNLLDLVYEGELELFTEYEVYVIVTNEYGCSSRSDVVLQALTDVVDENSGVTLAPHPVQDQFILLGLGEQPQRITFQSITGKSLSLPWQVVGSDVRVDTRSLSPGTYSVVLETSTELVRLTFVKL